MPIRPELRCFYGKEWREVTRPRILARAGDCCEDCGVPNHALATRAFGWWMLPPPLWWAKTWEPDQFPEVVWRCERGVHHGDNFNRISCRQVYIVLTISHLNHTAGDDRDENLKARCQWCHLTYDARFHKRTRCARKDAARPLLADLDWARQVVALGHPLAGNTPASNSLSESAPAARAGAIPQRTLTQEKEP